MEDLKCELEEMKEKINCLNESLEQFENENDELRRDIDKLETQFQEFREALTKGIGSSGLTVKEVNGIKSYMRRF